MVYSLQAKKTPVSYNGTMYPARLLTSTFVALAIVAWLTFRVWSYFYPAEASYSWSLETWQYVVLVVGFGILVVIAVALQERKS
jgi:hypothetical protein